MLDEHLTTCLDVDSGDLIQIPDDASDSTLQALDRRGYRGSKRLICPLCWAGVDAAPNTRVPVLIRTRAGRRPHFAHPAGRAPRTGQHSASALLQLTLRGTGTEESYRPADQQPTASTTARVRPQRPVAPRSAITQPDSLHAAAAGGVEYAAMTYDVGAVLPDIVDELAELGGVGEWQRRLLYKALGLYEECAVNTLADEFGEPGLQVLGLLERSGYVEVIQRCGIAKMRRTARGRRRGRMMTEQHRQH
ncbi:Uncharacterised protein [Mycobacteroides abscessus subsp. abscessus]|uniref:hypothetical protein n=1 Tax=Mycobacteroides abscessus TaxID=36809 RepID=UPI0009269A7C|nr:hypothetical protein [Mycobacteroides abscessus]SHU26701.1 Uncharacterised protein [Mycobacteroides abscessus subsp. abscessus]